MIDLQEIIVSLLVLAAAFIGGRFYGGKNQKAKEKQRQADVSKKREEAYEKINDRATDSADAAERLSKGDF